MTAFDCNWPIDESCLGSEWSSLDDTLKDRSIALASATLRRLTGYRVGGCPVTVRPCKQSCWGPTMPLSYYDMLGIGYGYGVSGFWPHLTSEGLWVNSCGCQTDCSCTALCSIALPPPVGRVDAVRIDGAVVPPTDYRLDGASVVWVGAGDCPFPTCQDMTLPDTQPNTFSITYLNAAPVDALGEYAAGVLAAEFAKACSGAKCRLPTSVTALTRQGVSMELPGGAFPGGLTGIREVDTYITLWNPQALAYQPRVWFPGINAPRVVPS